jgi:hypothetical protein
LRVGGRVAVVSRLDTEGDLLSPISRLADSLAVHSWLEIVALIVLGRGSDSSCRPGVSTMHVTMPPATARLSGPSDCGARLADWRERIRDASPRTSSTASIARGDEVLKKSS